MRVSAEQVYISSCARKMPHDTLVIAQREADRLSKATGHPIEPYRCGYCGGYHTGARPRERVDATGAYRGRVRKKRENHRSRT